MGGDRLHFYDCIFTSALGGRGGVYKCLAWSRRLFIPVVQKICEYETTLLLLEIW